MALLVKEDTTPHPFNIGLFCAVGVVLVLVAFEFKIHYTVFIKIGVGNGARGCYEACRPYIISIFALYRNFAV